MSKSTSSGQTRIELPRRGLNRRQFIYTTALAASSLAISASAASRVTRLKSPNEKLDIGIIGTGGKGQVDSEGLAGENIVALCDVDADTLLKAAKKWPFARLYRDYRYMLEKESKLDAVTVTIPDHHHAPAAMQAIKSGINVYC